MDALEKLGYEKTVDDKDHFHYSKKDGYCVIFFNNWIITGEPRQWGISKSGGYWPTMFTFPEVIACAKVIKKKEKEQLAIILKSIRDDVQKASGVPDFDKEQAKK